MKNETERGRVDVLPDIAGGVSMRVAKMKIEDVREVMAIERDSFTAPWPASAYRKELVENRTAHYLVLRRTGAAAAAAMLPQPRPMALHPQRRGFLSGLLPRFLWDHMGAPAPDLLSLAGYAGLWLVADEAHITTIAVRPQFRGLGLGELLLASMVEAALDINARWLTLEVRVSNSSAQALYRKYGFKDGGLRRHYYSDNGEDALIMWTEDLRSLAFQQRYQRLKASLVDRLVASGVLEPEPPGPGQPTNIRP